MINRNVNLRIENQIIEYKNGIKKCISAYTPYSNKKGGLVMKNEILSLVFQAMTFVVALFTAIIALVVAIIK